MAKTALSKGLARCPKCHKLQPAPQNLVRCVRCHGKFYQRNPRSLQYTLAWTITALIMFLPANYFPIMVYYELGTPDPMTILSGIDSLIGSGMYPIAFIVFTASFFVPLAKLFGLLFVVATAYQKITIPPIFAGKLYRVVDSLGPWSMLDVFVVALSGALVKFGIFTNVQPASGASYFTLMVVFSMFAAHSFDPRLLWDNIERENNKND